MEYLPYGETLVDEHQNSYNTPFKFNAKELDDETGNYYYGARYYNPKWSFWLSVDPLARYNPAFETEFYGDGQHNGGDYNNKNLNSYQYCYQSPIIHVDPNGKQVYFSEKGNLLNYIQGSNEVYIKNVTSHTRYSKAYYNANNAPNTVKNSVSISNVLPSSTHESYSTHFDCYAAATATLDNNNVKVGKYWSPDNQYQYQMYTDSNSPNVNIMNTRKAGFEKINSELEAGNPLLVGVNYNSGNSNPGTDKTTDHFILLTGRGIDNKGNLYYTGFENVDSGVNSDGTSTSQNRFYLQNDGTLQGGTTYRSGMTITQVRPIKSTE
jgi:RHS repeat-associated protein